MEMESGKYPNKERYVTLKVTVEFQKDRTVHWLVAGSSKRMPFLCDSGGISDEKLENKMNAFEVV